jgi:hypothetical protein
VTSLPHSTRLEIMLYLCYSKNHFLYNNSEFMVRFAMLIAFLFSISCLQAQISVHASSSVEKMMQEMIVRGKATESVKAWRIQIITTDDRREMEAARARFKSMHSDISMDWKHVAPYYQVRVGYFESKNKLMPFLLELKETFPAATPVYDNVRKADLLND